MSFLIALGLVSSMSAMAWAGPRVAQSIGEDLPLLAPLSRLNRAGAPYLACLLQLAVVLLLLLTSTFDAVLTYLGATLSFSTAITVLGVFVLRFREPELARPFRTWGYPVTPVLFLAVHGWMLAYLAVERPAAILWSGATILGGFGVYGLVARSKMRLSGP